MNDEFHISSNRKLHYPQLANSIYLDNAGCPPVAEPVLKNNYMQLSQELLGNIHSTGSSSASRTLKSVNNTRELILKHFNADPLNYSVIFVQNTTAALKLVAECINWEMVYLHECSHTSVIGIGVSVSNRMSLDVNDCVLTLNDNIFPEITHANENGYGIACYPAQCNFSGTRYPLSWINTLKQRNSSQLKVLVDAASYLTSSQIDLEAFPADFLTVSFYKMFGTPTSLAALIVRNENLELMNGYVGGGTVDAIAINPIYVRAIKSFARLEAGTLPFHEIVCLHNGFKFIQKVYGNYATLTKYVNYLCDDLLKEMNALKHLNGRPLCLIYGRDGGFEHGPIIAFNLYDFDAELISCSTFIKLANLNYFHLRSGRFCNPGACQKYLGLASNDISEMHEIHGYRCGDGQDSINGKPTGALRISLGYANDINDVKKFVCFLRQFTIQPINTNLHIDQSTVVSSGLLKRIHIYPIKSCQAYTLETCDISNSGFKYDRTWKLVDILNSTITQKKCVLMSTIRISDITDSYVRVEAVGMGALLIMNDQSNIFSCNEWFSRYLGQYCRLLYNRIDSENFSNTSGFLLINSKSIDAINSKSSLEISGDSFRANILVSNLPAFIENSWVGRTILIGNQSFYVESKCERCSMVCIDQKTGQKNKEVLMVLSNMCREKGKICFGVHLTHLKGESMAPFNVSNENYVKVVPLTNR